MKEAQNITRRLSRRLDIPAEAYSNAPRITISGGTRVLIEGHRGLLEYADERIAAAARGCTILIKGEELCIEAMSAGELVVSGRLWAVEFT